MQKRRALERFKSLSDDQVNQLEHSLLFLHVKELKDFASKLTLPETGRKKDLVDRILHFVKTGEIILMAKIPEVSLAQKGKFYPLHPETLILKGAYKNDLKTRQFFKTLIGDYFHFTAFGIDWINQRWLKGNPPTYQEFADMWKDEYSKRKVYGSQPKEEWAFINFAQEHVKQNQAIKKSDLIMAWKEERLKQFEIVNIILSSLLS